MSDNPGFGSYDQILLLTVSENASQILVRMQIIWGSVKSTGFDLYPPLFFKAPVFGAACTGL